MAQPLVTALAKGVLLAPSHLNLDRQMDTVQPWGCSPQKSSSSPWTPCPSPQGAASPRVQHPLRAACGCQVLGGYGLLQTGHAGFRAFVKGRN